MKRVLLIILIIVLAASVAVTSGCSVFGDNNSDTVSIKDVRTENQITEEATVTSLEIGNVCDEFELIPSTDGKLKIEYFDSKNYPYTYSFENGKAKFVAKPQIKLFTSFLSDPKPAKVYVPSSLADSIILTSASGSVTVAESANLNVKDLKVASSSGEVSLYNVVANDVDVAISSGSTIIKNLTADSLDMAVSSGDSTFDNCKIDEAELGSSSGRMTFNSCEIADFKLESSSGTVVANALISDDIFVDTSSGSVTMQINGNANDYSVKTKVSSGSVSISGTGLSLKSDDDVEWGVGAKSVYAESSSGSISIKFN